MSNFEFEGDQGVLTEDDQKVDVPKKFRVILLNDDYTTMEFVVYILENVFHRTPQESTTLMLAIHQTGRGVCGVYSREIAETKVSITMELAEKNEFPLRCIMEEE